MFAQATDLNGTPLAEVRLDGGMQVRAQKKDPWGEDRAISMPMRTKTAFHTGDDDVETGLVHMGAREYDPGTGRFISADPVLDDSDPLQANGYSYANNNPVTHSDPSGLTSSASSFDASIAALDAKIAEYQKTLNRSIGDVILATGWAVFKEFIGWNDVVGCFTQGDLWACGSLLMDAIPWTSVFSKGKKMWRAFKGTMSAVKAFKAAKRAAEIGMKAAKAAKAALIKAKKAAEAAAAEAKRKAREAAKRAAEAAKKKAHTGSKGARGNPVQVKARTQAQHKGSSGGGKAENKSGGSRNGSGKEDSGGGSCNSFAPETKVLMADGSTKAIKDVKAGDKVLATDPETGETRTETVTAEIKGQGVKHLVKVTIDVDGKKGSKTAEVTATDKHPFWVPELDDWIDATDLKAGEWLRTSAGTLVQITAVERWTTLSATVHNLTVSVLHTYYVLAGSVPVLVHNDSCPTGDAEFVRNQNLPSKAGPWKAYQEHVTGRSHEEVWRVNGRITQVDGGPSPIVVEAKWMGRNNAAFESSPYHPSNYFDESKFVDQARRLLALNSEIGGGGVRYAVSNEAGANYTRAVLREWFPSEMQSGILGVFHVPGDGM